MDCIFCKVANKEIRATVVYEDDQVVAFEDLNPQAPMHVLVIPRKHIPTVLDMTSEDTAVVGHMFEVAGRIARDREVAQRGFRMVINCNAEAGQSVYHIHLHVIGGRAMHWPPG
ncbi:MAG: histidine triad nucleotide-binding protein [Candidatus Magnetobacterium sp. LHC-1]|nr:histidine triad nucleotide-binding protein [Nitrospirota bacterium]